jgi:hypothetical protein
MNLQVLGQIEALTFAAIEIDGTQGLVTLKISSADGSAYATLTPAMVDDLIAMLRENQREATGESEGPF